MENCLFCSIIKGHEPAAVVFADKRFMVILDHRPLFLGHCLLIPTQHVETLADLPSSLVKPFFTLAQKLTEAVEEALDAEGTLVAMNNRVSQSVPHLHLHVVPRTKGDGLKGFFWPRVRYENDEAMLAIKHKLMTDLNKRLNE